MKLCEFLHFNKNCPICGEKLTLFMQWVNSKDSICFKGVLVDQDLYRFLPYIGGNVEKGEVNFWDEGMLLRDYGDRFETQFAAPRLAQEAKKFQIYFFYLCNKAGFDVEGKAFGDYEIDLYKGCYHRSTVMHEFQRDDDQDSKRWTLQVTNPEHKEIVNKDESFSLKSQSDSLEKVYYLKLDYEEKVTTLWHYVVTDDQKKQEAFDPNVFHKDMPILAKRPDLDPNARDKLISRFDSWIIMS